MRYAAFFTVLLILTINVYSDNLSDAKSKAKQRFSEFKGKDFISIQPGKQIPDEKKHLYIDAYNKLIEQNKVQPKLQSSPNQLNELPQNFRTPGEFEEVQAVLISWPSYAFDENGDYLEPFTPGVGLRWFQLENGEWDYKYVDIAGYVLDLYDESPYPYIWSQLADAISKEAKVWIRVAAPDDTTALKTWAAEKGYPLKNYEFKLDEDGENAFWMRDFGPFGVYYGDKDSLMFVIAEYYPGRPIDDNYPVKLAQELGYNYYKSKVELEGGNFMTDGHGMGFYSNVIYSNNSDNLGPAYTEKVPMGSNDVNNEMAKIFNLSKNVILPQLRCDGGTGHIDIYTKMANDEEILVTKYPEDFNKFTFPDYNTVKNNRELILALQTQFGNKYRFLEVPLPTDDDGKYNRTTCNSFNQDARTYINGLTINKTFIVPIYSNQGSGNTAGDNEALDVIKKHMPGYNVVGIDSRVLTVGGGAIHCITMQIPAENPVYVKHSQLKGVQNQDQILDENNQIAIKGIARNHSGFKSGTLNYRCADDLTGKWETAALEFTPASITAPEYNFIANIDYQKINCGYGKNIDYYLTFETNNGKNASKPIVAPEGYYTFNIGDPTSVQDFKDNSLTVFPNPADEYITIAYPSAKSDMTSEVQIFNMLGLEVFPSTQTSLNEGNLILDISGLPAGVYYVRVTGIAGKTSIIEKFVKM